MRAPVHKEDMMFGYVTADITNLTKEEKAKYKAHYCGLCHVLKEKYGNAGTSLLSYDMTFLEMLLSDLTDSKETSGTERCITNPIKEHRYITTECTAYAADMQMMLAYYSALDDQADEGKGSSALKKTEPYMKELAEKYPRQDIVLRNELSMLADDQNRKIKDAELLSRHSGTFLGEVFVMDEKSFFRDDLWALGYGLGRFVYIMDAWCDRKKDARKGIFNPLPADASWDDVKEMLISAAADASAALERLPLDEHISILRNVLYSGIWLRGEHSKEKRR